MTNSSTKKTIVLCFSLNYSTYSEYLIALANQLANTYRVMVVVDQIKEHPFQLSEEITVLKWPTASTTSIADLKFFYQLCKKEKVKMVIANFSAVNVAMIASKLAGVPHRIAWARTVYNAGERTRIGNLRKGFVYSCASLVIANSKSKKEDLMQNDYVPASKIQIRYNCLRDGIIAPGNVVNQRIVFAGRLAPVKNVPGIIKAFALISKDFPQAEVHIYGGKLDGKIIPELKELASQYGVLAQCHFHGDVSRNDLLYAYSQGYVGVFPSFVEAFGNVVNEGFSMGLPAIVSRDTGMSEIVQDGVNGLYCNPYAIEDIAEKMRTILSQPALREQMAKAARERFLEAFEMERQLKSMVQQIKELCA